METIARVRREHAKGKSARQIAQGLGISRDTVTKYLKSGVTEVRYERQKQSFPQILRTVDMTSQPSVLLPKTL